MRSGWKESTYGGAHRRVGQFALTVSWAISAPRGYVARFDTHTLKQRFQDVDEAVAAAEALARRVLNKALFELGPAPGGATEEGSGS